MSLCRHAIVLSPDEASLLVSGWPPGAWLVAIEDGGRRWDVGGEADLPAIVGDLPVWPPLPGFGEAEVAAEDEAALVRHLAALPGLAEEAASRLAPRESAGGPEPEPPLVWDDD